MDSKLPESVPRVNSDPLDPHTRFALRLRGWFLDSVKAAGREIDDAELAVAVGYVNGRRCGRGSRE
jgi:hypothetical protein